MRSRARPPVRRRPRVRVEGSAGSALQPQFPFPLRQGAQPQRVELDEARGVAVVVGDGALLEGDEVLVVERIGALAADDVDAALVELQPHLAGDQFLALVDERLQHLALGREPEAVVDELGVFRHQLVLEVRGAAVERDRLDAPVGEEQDGAAGGLVDAAALHADEAVLDEVEAADAVVRPSSLSLASSAAGASLSPSMATGSPFSKSMVMTVGLSGAYSGSMVRE